MDREDLLGEIAESDVSFGEFVPRYLEYAQREQTPLAYHSIRNLIPNRLGPFFAHMRLRTIRPADIEAYMATRRRVKGPTRNRELSALSGIFRHAQDLGIVRRNPTKDVRRSSEPQTPLPLVPLGEQQNLVDAVAEPYRLLVSLALESGMRLGEMLRLQWRDIDFSTSSILVRETKGKRPRLLSMSRRLRAILEEEASGRTRPLRGPDPVLAGACMADGSLAKAWRLAFKEGAARIGRPELRIHDCRHIVAINLVRAGMDLPTVGAFLGHRSLVSTLRYAGYSDGSAAARAARLLNEIQAGEVHARVKTDVPS
ncbi:MAG: tyrosine-type recombinase/integrase [Planctomycetota bacterium]|nr:tyrosine-type recombinase/integrase [Planctomycetota bacterium]